MRSFFTLLVVLLACTHQTFAQSAIYAFNPGDELEISVWQEPDLQRRVLVRPDGNISLPLVGEIRAAGRGTVAIQQEIIEKLEKYIPDPVVTVSVVSINGNRIYVIGQVKNPGAFIMNPDLTVVQALSVAGGTTPFASLSDIIIIREAGSDQRVFEFSFSDISRGRNLEQNIVLRSGDVIIVP